MSMRVCVSVCVCVSACVRAFLSECMYATVRLCARISVCWYV